MFSFIKEITISGFKSFADKTTIQLKEGLNMIVGPNGCGKSNVIDAFCWGIGESRLKNLRAAKSEDIIFSGTNTRHASHMASVSFVIDNKTRVLSIDEDEVFVKRTLTQEGESQFFLNKKECRLKDVQQLFLDTGLGRNSYAIMQQGRIDQIMTGKPEDRRLILEEVAGISRSRLLVRESKQKLQKTDDNLNRLADILKEVEAQVIVLKEQSEKALAYKSLKSDIEMMEKDIFIFRYIHILNRIVTNQEKNDLLNQKMKDYKTQIKEAKDSMISLSEEIASFEEEIYTIKNKEQEALITEARLGQKIELLRKEHEDNKKSTQKLVEKKQNFTNSISEKEKIEKTLFQTMEYSLFKKEELENEKKVITSKIEEIDKNYTLIEDSLIKEEETIMSLEKKMHEGLLKDQEFFLSIFDALGEDDISVKNQIQNKNKYHAQINETLLTLLSYKKKWTFLTEENQTLTPQETDSLRLDLKEALKLINSLNALYQEYHLYVTDVIASFNTESLMSEKERSTKVSKDLEKSLLKEKELKLNLQIELKKVKEEKERLLKTYEKDFIDLESFRQKNMESSITHEKLKEEIAFYKEQESSVDREIEEYESKKDLIEEEIFALLEGYEKCQSIKKEIQKKVESLKKKSQEQTQLLNQESESEKRILKELSEMGEKLNKYYLNEKEYLLEKNMVMDEYLSRYGEKLDKIAGFETELFQENKDKIPDIMSMQKKIREKKDKVESIGLVNFLSIEEYEEVKTRYDFLNSNKQDVEKSKADLEFLIQDLYHKAKEDFLSVFTKVNENINTIFTRAFEGGSCSMQMVNPQDPLESGIEIIAKPPGKKLQNLTLLSGGEKTMVALSVMFGIFMVKPSPFCVMDEVDAALDELNIKRFLRILLEFKPHVQFLVITHNRVTAQKGDVFYGVTMQETGVTKVFSFKPENKNETEIA